MKKNVSGQVIGCQLISKTDGSAVTSGTTTVYVTGDGGTQAAGSVGSGACTHEGQGFWTYAPAQAETNYDHIAFTFVNTSACNATIQVYPTFPQTGDSFARVGAPVGASISADIAAVQTAINTVDDFVDTEVAAILAAVDTEVAAIKTKTDFLPSATAGAAGGLLIAGINAATTVDITGNITGNLSGSVGSVTGAVGSVTGAVGSVTGSVGSVTGNVGGNVVGSVASVTAGVTVSTNNDKTGYTVAAGGIGATSFAAGAIDAAAIAANAIGASELAQDAAQEIADEVLNRNIAGGGSGDSRNVRNALRALRNKVAISGGTLTVYQEDDASNAWTATVATTAGDPVSSIDPA